MSHGYPFKPGDLYAKAGVEEVVKEGEAFMLPLDRVRDSFFDVFGHVTPPTITVTCERHQLGAWIHVTGGGWTPGATVRFTAIGVSYKAGPYSIGGFDNADPTGRIDIWLDTRVQHVPQEQWTPVTLHAKEDGSNKEATASLPYYTFYV